jgi:hyperosmotically inducible protein
MDLLQDAELTLKIKAALIADELIRAGSVNVDTLNGAVTLRGKVPNEAVREVAEGIALRNGARRVVNELLIENPAGEAGRTSLPDDLPQVTAPAGAPVVERKPSLAQRVKAALAADPRVNEHLIEVREERGFISLTGRQDTVGASAAATEVVAHVPGVLGVNNDLEVMPSV